MEKSEYKYIDGGIEVLSGTVYIAYVCMGGSGCNVVSQSKGTWYEGVEELIAVCTTEKEAWDAVDKFMGYKK